MKYVYKMQEEKMTFPFNVDHLSVCIHGIKANDN